MRLLLIYKAKYLRDDGEQVLTRVTTAKLAMQPQRDIEIEPQI